MILRNQYGGNIQGANNYWNTTDTSTIQNEIYDSNDDFSLSNAIVYLPILTSPDSKTPTFCKSISIRSNPSTTTYVQGQNLDLTGAILTASYNDGSTQDVPITSDMVSGFNPSQTGTQTLTVTYEGQTTTFNVAVTTKTITGIKMKTSPSTITYIQGQNLNITGATLTASYNDGSTQDVPITSDMVSGFNSRQTGTQTLTVTYEGQTTTFSVAVTAKTITIGQYDGTDLTNKPITVTATTGSDATFSAATGETVSADGHTASYTFSKNGSFTFTATDAAGNTTSKTLTISNIDTTPPTVTIGQYDGTDPTNKPITVTATTGSDATFSAATGETVSANGHTASYTFSKNGSFTFTATDAAGNTTTKMVAISNIIQNSNARPLTDIDFPSDSATVNGTMNISGWALNGSGINRVDVYAFDSNGKPHSLGSVAGKDLTDRTDVAKAFANDGYENINSSGYSLSVDTTKLSGGTYTLAVAGIGNNGVVQWETKAIKVTTPQPITDVDSPANGSFVSGKVNVSGWALNVSGINRVDVYAFDGNGKPHSLGSVASKNLTDRGDVAKAFANAGYKNINSSGYSLSVDTTQLSSGTYTLAVAGIGNNGVVQWETKAIKVTTPQPITDVDSPANGSFVSGKVNVSGWALNVSGINRVDVYAFDGNGKPHSLGSVASKNLTDRGDVAKAFANAGYKNINSSGYSLSVDTTQLSSGTYTLAVAGIGNNGVVQWETKTIKVQ
ncbi:MAG: bacterial Ig-like domain-containing protein [Ethanoligenens sp.]